MTRAAILIIVTIALVSCSKTPDHLLAGGWTGQDSTGQTAMFVFERDGTVKFIMGHLVADGPTVGASVKWRLDTRQTPMHLDIVVKSPSSQERILPMIVRFISDQQIQIRTSEDMQSRPTSFSTEDSSNQLVLVKRR